VGVSLTACGERFIDSWFSRVTFASFGEVWGVRSHPIVRPMVMQMKSLNETLPFLFVGTIVSLLATSLLPSSQLECIL
jgi:hypothetical protein